MAKFTLVLDCIVDKKVKDYLLKINGINKVSIENYSNFNIEIEYDKKIISPLTIKQEIMLFLKVSIPSIVGFDKYMDSSKDYQMIINDLCCEYCLKNMIENMLSLDYITYASTNFDNIHKKNVVINVKYDNEVDISNVKELEEKINGN